MGTRQKSDLGNYVRVRHANGTEQEIPVKQVDSYTRTIDWSGYERCENCNTYTSKNGFLLGALGRLSVYFLDPERTWISYSVACPECWFGAYAHQEYRHGDTYRPALPYDFDKRKYIPPGLSWKEWRVLGLWAAKGDTYLDAAEKITTEGKWADAKDRLVDKLKRWENER